MAAEATCPRCGTVLQVPTLMHHDFRCSRHGVVTPLWPTVVPDGPRLASLVAAADVPVWLPWPLPVTWMFTGIRLAGGGAAPITGAAVGVTGAALTSGPADIIIVSEQPGTGLGARFAGLAAVDPDDSDLARAADTSVRVAGWPTPMWALPPDGEDRAAYVGEAGGEWLWLIARPEIAWSVIHDDLRLVDLRSSIPLGDLPVGAAMPRLTG